MNKKYIGKIIKFGTDYFVVIGYDYFCEKYICKNLKFKNGSYINLEINETDLMEIETVIENTKTEYEELELVNKEINSVYDKINSKYLTSYDSLCFTNMFLRLREINKNIKSIEYILNNFENLTKEEIKLYKKEVHMCGKGKRRVYKRLYSYVNRKNFDKFVEIMEKYDNSLTTVKYKKDYMQVMFDNLNILKEYIQKEVDNNE